MGHRLQGELALQTKPKKAARHFEKSIVILQEIKADYVLALAYAGYGRYFRLRGHLSQPREYLNKAL